MATMNVQVDGPIREDTGFRVDYVDSDGVLHIGSVAQKILVTAEADLSDLPDIYAPGSTAYLADGTGLWVLGADGTWESNFTPASDPDDP